MTASTLRSYTCKDLAQLAKGEGVAGWHSMRKDELVTALVKIARLRSRKPASKSNNGVSRKVPQNGQDRRPPGPTARTAPQMSRVSPAHRRAQQHLSQLQMKLAARKNLTTALVPNPANQVRVDRLVVMVRDPYWLHAYWELSAHSIARAQSSLGQKWHAAQPVLRLCRVMEDGSGKLEREIEIHGGVNNWYVDVKDPPTSYKLEIGYAARGDFYCLARSNTVTTPMSGSSETVDSNWRDVAENVDRIFAMSGGYSAHGTSLELQELLEERLHRRLGRPSQTRFGSGAAGSSPDGELRFAVDAELVVYGATAPSAHVTVKGEPVNLRPDGTFAVRMHLPDRRQVIPVVASSADGVEQRTIILGVERNTKVLDPLIRDPAG